MHYVFLYISKTNFSVNSGRNLTTRLGFVPVDWNPEKGYPAKLPDRYYPRTAVGKHILSLIYIFLIYIYLL